MCLVWRKRVGIEPTAAGVTPRPDGFEGRASHQTRTTSKKIETRALRAATTRTALAAD
jgi:hypothetical protein